MLFRTLACGLVVVAGSLLTAAPAHAQFFAPFDSCGTAMRRPVVNPCFDPCAGCGLPACNCATPAPVLVPQTTYVPQSQVSYRDVVETHLRHETVAQQVPVTRYRQVTVDEGSYQTVWVPRVVTKQIPETTYESRLSTRAVPYQVTRRIPEVTTQMVPVQTSAWAAGGIVSQPYYPTYTAAPLVQLQQPVLAQPTPAYAPSTSAIRVDPYDNGSSGELAPNPVYMEPPTVDDQARLDGGARRSGYVTSRSASAVFQRYR